LSKLNTAQNLDDLSNLVKDFFFWREDVKDYVNNQTEIPDALQAFFFKPSKVLAVGLTLGESFNGTKAEKVKVLFDTEISEINNKLSGVTDKKKIKYESYNPKTLKIIVGGNECKIGTKVDSDHALLMKLLSKTPNKILNTGEILEKAYGIDSVNDREEFRNALSKNKVYFAGQVIVEKIERELHLPKFLLVSEKSIQINPIYR
jgi:hypothetical protein